MFLSRSLSFFLALLALLRAPYLSCSVALSRSRALALSLSRSLAPSLSHALSLALLRTLLRMLSLAFFLSIFLWCPRSLYLHEKVFFSPLPPPLSTTPFLCLLIALNGVPRHCPSLTSARHIFLPAYFLLSIFIFACVTADMHPFVASAYDGTATTTWGHGNGSTNALYAIRSTTPASGASSRAAAARRHACRACSARRISLHGPCFPWHSTRQVCVLMAG